MAVQDDARETEVRELIGLRAGAGRSDIDAFFDFTFDGRQYATPIELKSTTVGAVSTGRDIGPDHLAKWRHRVWVVAFYDPRGTALQQLLVLGPDDMDAWISSIEDYIGPDFQIASRARRRLTSLDMQIVCGEKPKYSLDDAKRLFKRQWTADRYATEMDLEDGYSPKKMLEVFQLRAEYLVRRGATLNNPHIPKRYLAGFADRLFELGAAKKTQRQRHIEGVRQQIREVTLADAELERVSRSPARGPDRNPA